ncbi:MAG: porin, partial [Candidatus Eremiobacteraeota bacterium]|nr:porin [Candidatus Eremiobacteraeota bacterium]
LDTVTGADTGSRTDYENILFSVTRNTGVFRFGANIGEYAFPVVGQSLNPTFRIGSNTDLFSYVPLAYVQYVPSSTWTFSAGKLGTLLGSEGIFTFQNANIQRGLVWNAEPVVSRGVRATYAQGKFSGNLEYNDGYYSGKLGAIEGLLGWAASPNTTAQFAWIVPQASARSNPTAFIANRREANLMLAQTFGKLQLNPYLLWIDSPGNTALGFNGDERAFGAVFAANYTFDAGWSLAARYESITNRSNASDPSLNADLVGFGPGSAATTWTLTPAFKTGHTSIRAEYSAVNLSSFTPGLGFGPAGILRSQTRIGAEIGVQF